MNQNENPVQDTAEFADELNDEALDRSIGLHAAVCPCMTRKPED